MSGLSLLSGFWALGLLWTTSRAVILPDSVEQGPVSLNEMFREVEELMEDTQHLLDEAVDQVSVTFDPFRSGQGTTTEPGLIYQKAPSGWAEVLVSKSDSLCAL